MKLAIVHRSPAAIRAFELTVRQHGPHSLIWTTMDGREALRRCQSQPPEALFIEAGIRSPTATELTRSVLAAHQCAILLLAERPDANLSEVYQAMGAGALDVVTAPALDAQGATINDAALRSKLTSIGRVLGLSIGAPRRNSGQTSAVEPRAPLIAIGASTGGPQAILQVLSGLPRPLGAAVVIVQHIDGEFAPGLTQWLTQDTGIPVRIATRGSRPEAGVALVAGAGGHLVFTRGDALGYTEEPKNTPHCPSVDVLFNSLAQHSQVPGIAILLTGMGRDGAEGLARLRSARWRTIAQDEATSVVFGMPKAAIQLGGAERVLPIAEVGPTVGRWLKEKRSGT